MSSLSRIYWPAPFSGCSNSSSWNENTHSQLQLNAAGEKFGMLVPFDGSELDYVEVALGAGTQADTIQLTIEDYVEADTSNVGGMPDGTAIANSTISVSNKGGSNEVVRWTFGATGPSPIGYKWLVFEASSAGVFNVLFKYTADWAVNTSFAGANSGVRLYTTAWSGVVTVGTPIMRIKQKDGAFVRSVPFIFPPLTDIECTFNSVHAARYDNLGGAKFTAPFTGQAIGGTAAITGQDAYIVYKAFLLDASDNILAESDIGYHWGLTNRFTEFVFEVPAAVTAGDTYRLVFHNPLGVLDSNRLQIITVDVPSGTYEMFGLVENEIVYTNATDPVCIGGVGAWTDNSLVMPIMQLVGLEDFSAGGGATGTIGWGEA
jgi:hypothetical protein